MPTPTSDHRREIAERNAEAILAAALRLLARGGPTSIAAIAAEAGVSRVTVYAHFESRDAVIEALTQRGVGEVTRSIQAAEPERGDPRDALARVVRSAWETLGSYHALIEINMQRPHTALHDSHHSALSVLGPLVERGQRDEVFRPDVPASWHLATILALIHAASSELQAERLPQQKVEEALVKSVLGALS